MEEVEKISQKLKKNIWFAVAIMLGLILFFNCFYIVEAGERAIVLTFGNPSMTEMSEGLHLKFPIVQTIEIMDIKTQKYESDSSAASSDLQIVTAKIALNYHLESSSVPIIYKEIGRDYQSRIIQPAEQESVKAITAKFTAEELITKREEVRQEIKTLLIEKLGKRGIVIEDVLITNFDFSEEFNKAIEAKVTAEQNALAAKNKLVQIEYEAQQIVTKATADAEALRLQRQEITPDLVALRQLDVQRELIEKWNGVMPLVLGSGQMIYDLNNLVVGTTQI